MTTMNLMIIKDPAIKDPEVPSLLYMATESDGQYQELVALLKERYNQQRFIHMTYTMAIIHYMLQLLSMAVTLNSVSLLTT